MESCILALEVGENFLFGLSAIKKIESPGKNRGTLRKKIEKAGKNDPKTGKNWKNPMKFLEIGGKNTKNEKRPNKIVDAA